MSGGSRGLLTHARCPPCRDRRDCVARGPPRCGPVSGSKSPSALCDDPAPCARLVAPTAQAAPPHPGAQPEPLGSSPWPEQPASGRPKVQGVFRFQPPGWWLWKPLVMYDALTRLPDGGVLVYADAGHHFEGRCAPRRFAAARKNGPAHPGDPRPPPRHQPCRPVRSGRRLACTPRRNDPWPPRHVAGTRWSSHARHAVARPAPPPSCAGPPTAVVQAAPRRRRPARCGHARCARSPTACTAARTRRAASWATTAPPLVDRASDAV